MVLTYTIAGIVSAMVFLTNELLEESMKEDIDPRLHFGTIEYDGDNYEVYTEFVEPANNVKVIISNPVSQFSCWLHEIDRFPIRSIYVTAWTMMRDHIYAVFFSDL